MLRLSLLLHRFRGHRKHNSLSEPRYLQREVSKQCADREQGRDSECILPDFEIRRLGGSVRGFVISDEKSLRYSVAAGEGRRVRKVAWKSA